MTVQWIKTAIYFSFLAALCSCASEEEGELPLAPTLGDVQRLVFTPACATSGCHDQSAAGQLDLSNVTVSRNALIGIVPVNGPARKSGWRLVTPGNVEESFLFRKITQPGLGEGAAMPLGKQLTDPYTELVRRWIEDGAP